MCFEGGVQRKLAFVTEFCGGVMSTSKKTEDKKAKEISKLLPVRVWVSAM